MEAKKKHNQEVPMASQPGLTPPGNKQTTTTLIFLPFQKQHSFMCSRPRLGINSATATYVQTSITKQSTAACTACLPEEVKLQNSAVSG